MKQYNFPMTLDSQFKDKLEGLHDKYGIEMMNIEGMSPEQLDTCKFFDNFIKTKVVADASIDDNANVTNKNVNTMINESQKPFLKLLSRNKIYIEMKEEFGKEVADEFLEKAVNGEIYEHDSFFSSLIPYCYSFSLEKIVHNGLFFLKEMKAEAPKHWDTFNHHMLEFVSYATNQVAGAVGTPDYLVYAYYFYKKDTENMTETEKEKYRNQKFQELIYNLNQPYLKSGIQSAYSNFSILDSEHLDKFFEGKFYPDGTFILDCKEGIKQFQSYFLRYIGELRKKKWHTFPVISASLVFRDGKYTDEETAKMVVKHNWEFGFNDVNIMNVDKVTSAASCCFDGNQKILTKNNNSVNLLTFKEFAKSSYNKDNLKIFHNGCWEKGRLVELPKRKLYKVTTMNNKEILVTDNHLNSTLRGDIFTENLTVDDYLMFNTMELYSIPECDNKLTYEQGMLIGYYLSDYDYISYNNGLNGLDFNFNIDKNNTLSSILNKVKKQMNLPEEISGTIPQDNYITMYSDKLVNFVKTWVNGNHTTDKELNLDCLLQSLKFRKGILDGVYSASRADTNEIHIKSVKLVEQLECLITSLGKVSNIDVKDNMKDKGMEKNYSTYCIKCYEPKHKRVMEDLYKVHNNTIFFKIKSIEEIDNNTKNVYCFEMENEHYFTLPNGITTHNCRLVNNLEDLRGSVFNSIGGTSLNVGSTKVVTLNLVRLALLAKDERDFMNLIQNDTELIHKYHYAQRKTLKKLIDKGMLPLYTHGLMSLSDQFATIGINGVFESVKILGGIDTDEHQNVKYNEEGYKIAGEMFKVILDENDKTSEKYGFMSNVEQVPAESAAIKLAKKDRIYFGNRFINEKLGNDCYIYGNQWIPLKENATIFSRIESAKLDENCGGGAILHINLGENFNTFDDAWNFTQGLAKQGVGYFSYISLIDICKNDHSFFGNTCPICGGESVSKGIKIVGYMVKQDSYKKERKKELCERKFYDI